MLNQNLQQDPSASSTTNTPNAGADNVRVTTEEFVAAINRIDARRAQESAHVNGTVAIGQTLRDLHVDANADEVLREIEQMRREAVAEAPVVAQQKPAQKQGVESSATAAVLDAKQEKRARRRQIWLRIWAGLAIFTLGGFAGYAIDESNSPDIAGLHNLSFMQNGQELFVTTDSVEKLVAGGGSSVVVSSILGENRAGGDYIWPVVMKSGQLEVLAYVDRAEQATQAGTLHLYNYNSDDGPPKTQTVAAVPILGTAIVRANEDSSDTPEITVQRTAEAAPAQPGK